MWYIQPSRQKTAALTKRQKCRFDHSIYRVKSISPLSHRSGTKPQNRNYWFSLKARYVNDVHLPRFGLASATRRDAAGTVRTLYETATRSQMHHGDSKDFSPSNSWNDSTNGDGASMAARRPNSQTGGFIFYQLPRRYRKRRCATQSGSRRQSRTATTVTSEPDLS